ncbi:hypothetical protein ABZ342_19795 [Amycolatopsis sp. NPDC005961]|uniref:hypothetical protein n=1 Tax=Amycolatopsis sp. NPDC005961 TaxID=3156720 RepID=UPI003411BE89
MEVIVVLEGVLAVLNGVLTAPRDVLREIFKPEDRKPDPDGTSIPTGADDDPNPPDYPG